MWTACDVCGIAHDPMKLCKLKHLKAFFSGSLDRDLAETSEPVFENAVTGEDFRDDFD